MLNGRWRHDDGIEDGIELEGDRMTYIEWTPDLGEISGFGGGYEAACRAMVRAGVEFADTQDASAARGERAPFDPQFRGFKNIYGVIQEENDDARNLSAAMVAASGGDCTGAMHQASVGHVLAFRRLGAEEYCRQLRERPDD